MTVSLPLVEIAQGVWEPQREQPHLPGEVPEGFLDEAASMWSPERQIEISQRRLYRGRHTRWRVKSWRGEKNHAFRKLKMAQCSQRAGFWGNRGWPDVPLRNSLGQIMKDSVRQRRREG